MRVFFRSLSGQNSVRSASAILVVTLTLSNILGLLRDRFLAKNISFSDLDIYFAAFRIPDTVFNFLILGAITSAFIPVFSDLISNGEEKRGHKVASCMMNIGFVLMIMMASILFLLIPLIIPCMFPDFSTANLNQVIKLSQILMLTPVFFSISYIISGILNSYGRFLAFSLSPLLYNLSIIFGTLFIAPHYGLIGVVYFVVLGSILHALIQIPALARCGFRYSLSFDLSDPALKRIGRLMVPRNVSLGVNQILLTAYTSIGASLASGAIAAFNFAQNIQTVPTVILGSSFATAVFPTLSRKIAEKDRDGFSFYLTRAIRVIGFLLIPSTVIFILLRAQIVRLVIGTGKVNWDNTRMTALVLACFSISMLAQGLIPLLARAFFAMKNTRFPMYVSIITVIFSIALAYPLTYSLNVSGLSLAFSIGSFLQLFMFLWALRKEYPNVCGKSLVRSYWRTTVVSAIMAGFVWPTMHITANYVDMHRFSGVLMQTLVSMGVGLASYVGISYLLESEELNWALTRRISDKQKEFTEKELL